MGLEHCVRLALLSLLPLLALLGWLGLLLGEVNCLVGRVGLVGFLAPVALTRHVRGYRVTKG